MQVANSILNLLNYMMFHHCSSHLPRTFSSALVIPQATSPGSGWPLGEASNRQRVAVQWLWESMVTWWTWRTWGVHRAGDFKWNITIQFSGDFMGIFWWFFMGFCGDYTHVLWNMGFYGGLMGFNVTRPGKHRNKYGKSWFFMGKSTISMAMFNSYVTITTG